jgi:hypothetical protein
LARLLLRITVGFVRVVTWPARVAFRLAVAVSRRLVAMGVAVARVALWPWRLAWRVATWPVRAAGRGAWRRARSVKPAVSAPLAKVAPAVVATTAKVAPAVTATTAKVTPAVTATTARLAATAAETAHRAAAMVAPAVSSTRRRRTKAASGPAGVARRAGALAGQVFAFPTTLATGIGRSAGMAAADLRLGVLAVLRFLGAPLRALGRGFRAGEAAALGGHEARAAARERAAAPAAAAETKPKGKAVRARRAAREAHPVTVAERGTGKLRYGGVVELRDPPSDDVKPGTVVLFAEDDVRLDEAG